MQNVIITCPSLDSDKNISGISSVTKFIISNNSKCKYTHFELGKTDDEKRGLYWFLRNVKAWVQWFWLMISQWNMIVHFNISLTMRSVLRDLPLLLFAQMLGKKLIIHFHGGDYLQCRMPPRWVAFLLKLCLSRNDPKIVLSETERNLLLSRYNAKQVHVLPNCIDLTDAKKYNYKNKVNLPLQILYLGRIDRNKGLDYILQALNELKNKKPGSFVFTIAGTGPDKEYYTSGFRTSLGTSFKYAGVVRGKQKAELLRNSNIFLLPSLYEGLPMSLLENMAYGNVPVVTDVGSVGTVIRNMENGIIVNKQSSDDIISALEQLSEDIDFANQLGENARKDLFQLFDPDKYLKNLNDLYEQTKMNQKTFTESMSTNPLPSQKTIQKKN